MILRTFYLIIIKLLTSLKLIVRIYSDMNTNHIFTCIHLGIKMVTFNLRDDEFIIIIFISIVNRCKYSAY